MIDLDRFMKIDFARGVQAEISRIQRNIQDIKTTCGSCKMWMTSDCPREKIVKASGGMSVCDIFQIQSLSEKVIQSLEVEILNLNQSIQENA